MFSGAHLHLLLNHLPIIGPAFIIPLLIAGLWRKHSLLIRATLIMTVATALGTIPAYLTGEEAEEAVEGIIGVNQSAIETHETMAEVAYYSMLMAGAIALGALLAASGGKPVSQPLAWLTLVVLAATFILMARTGYSGGQIRHSEINRSYAPAGEGHDSD